MIDITIISSVHKNIDTRIYHKQLKSLCEKYSICYIVKKEKNLGSVDFKTIDFPIISNRFRRILLSPFIMFKLCLRNKTRAYLIHDPELLFTAVLLKIFTKSKIVYDIHEDYFTSIYQKPYLKKPFNIVLANIFRVIEKSIIKTCIDKVLIAERYYEEFQPDSIKILNYPICMDSKVNHRNYPLEKNLLYTGGITIDRGAFIHAKLANYKDDTKVYCVGFCPKQLSLEMKNYVKDKDKLIFNGIDKYLDRAEIDDYYKQDKWIAALAIFPVTKHYYKKELTKLFEYMSYGIPIICSNFPVWKMLIEGNNCGICVDPNNEEEINNAIETLKNNNELWFSLSKNAIIASKKYNWESQANILLKVFKELFIK